MCRQVLLEPDVVTFYENPFSGSRVLAKHRLLLLLLLLVLLLLLLVLLLSAMSSIAVFIPPGKVRWTNRHKVQCVLLLLLNVI